MKHAKNLWLQLFLVKTKFREKKFINPNVLEPNITQDWPSTLVNHKQTPSLDFFESVRNIPFSSI
jgi:hypothetical protein